MIKIEENHVLLLYSCDACHSHSGKELLGVFSEFERFIDYISDMKLKGKLSDEDAECLLTQNRTQGLDENCILEEEILNPTLSV
jgi:hypothetical protein